MVKRTNINRLGFTLVETIIAIAVLSMAVIGPLSVATTSINSGIASKNQLTAFYLAQEAMEYVKNKRDENSPVLGNKNWLDGLIAGFCNSANGCSIDVLADSINNCPETCPVIKLYDNGTIKKYTYTDGDDTIFTRTIKVDENPLNVEAKVTVTVTWDDRVASGRKVELVEHIFNIWE